MEEKQSSSQFIGLMLIFVLVYFWLQTMAPEKKPEAGKTPEQIAQDSLQNLQNQQASAAPQTVQVPDSQKVAMLSGRLGGFAGAGVGSEQEMVLENDLVRVKFTSKGGRIREVLLKKYQKINEIGREDVAMPLYLFEDSKNRWDYNLPIAGAAGGFVNTSELYFTPTVAGNSVTFRANAANGQFFEQTYSLAADDYRIDHKISASGIPTAQLTVQNYLDKIEKNQSYERSMSSVYFKTGEEEPDYCSCRSNETKNLGGQPVEWFAQTHQFFNTSVLAQGFAFRDFTGETFMLTDADADLKILKSTATIPLDNGSATMAIYSGPNEFDRLKAYGRDFESIIPFGSSIFGSINRWVIHPMFVFLSSFVGNMGIVIILLTLLVKLIVYPLTYRMVMSQSRMSALKPQIDEIKKKHGDDQQAVSMETMKLYNEWGVNPLGGCFPMLAQMPIWFALYRFFPASIEFRQAGFLWATDLSSYDVIAKLPMDLPFGFGHHISLFTLLWVVTTLWYTWYSMKQMDSAMMNPMMKYMQYFMPVMFLFFFNSFASGLSCYLSFSNILNIGQMVGTKKWLIDQDAIKAKLEENRKKPKKKSAFRERLDEAMKQAQEQQAAKQKQDSQRKKK